MKNTKPMKKVIRIRNNNLKNILILVISIFFTVIQFFGSHRLTAQEILHYPAFDVATPFLDLGHPSYEYITLLQTRGYLSKLNISVRPYNRGEVAAALMSLDSNTTLSKNELLWVNFLRDEFSKEIRLLRQSGHSVLADAGTELTNTLFTENNRLYDDYRIDPALHFSTLHFTSALRGRLDRSLLRDKTYTGRNAGRLGARLEDGYGRFDYHAFYCAIGRFAEEWSPVAGQSLIISPEAYTYDKFQLGILTNNIQFRSLFAMLEDFNTAKRYVSAHRLDIQLNNGMHFGLSESIVYGGVNQTVDLAYLNPFSIFAEVQLNQKKEANENIAFDFSVPYRRFLFSGQILVDDFILDGAGSPPPNRKTSPDRLGMTYRILGNDLLLNNTQMSVMYERIGSYTYNVKQKRPWQSYTYQGKGLGAPANDMDHIRLSWKYFPLPKWIFSAEVYYKRQGERTLLSHDFEDPTFVKLPFPSGRVEETAGIYASALFHNWHDLHVKFETGYAYVKNHRNLKKDKSLLNGLLNIEYYFSRTLFNE